MNIYSNKNISKWLCEDATKINDNEIMLILVKSLLKYILSLKFSSTIYLPKTRDRKTDL